MKKIIAMLLAVMMIAGVFAGCGAAETPAAPATEAPVADAPATEAPATEAAIKTVTPGVLTVAISPDFAPMEFVDPTKEG